MFYQHPIALFYPQTLLLAHEISIREISLIIVNVGQSEKEFKTKQNKIKYKKKKKTEKYH